MASQAVGKSNQTERIRISRSSKFEHLISPSVDRARPIYNWHSFKHSYSKGLVDLLIERFGLDENSWVLDPFCGGGTTLLACKEKGINALGLDLMPFSVFLTNVKTRNYDPDSLRSYLSRLGEACTNGTGVHRLPDIGIVNKAFPPKIQSVLIDLRTRIRRIRDMQVRDFYLLGLLSILESVSNTSKAGGFLRIQQKAISPEIVRKTFLNRIQQMIKDVEAVEKAPMSSDPTVKARVADARRAGTERQFDAIITSPPYPNRHDYTRIYALELIVGFINSNQKLKELRYQTLRSHVEARRQFRATAYRAPAKLENLVESIRKSELNNPQVPAMIEGYFEDMYLCLIQMSKRLKPGGKLALVVSNVRFGGINVPVDRLLAEVGVQAGLSLEAIVVARRRGNSAQQMKRFRRKPSRESIVIWKNSDK